MKTHTGFTLIEVLVAMLVLALGLMGLATLQTYTLRSNLSAYTRGQATQLLYDMSDKMRVNNALAKTITSNTSDYTVADTTTKIKKIDSSNTCEYQYPTTLPANTSCSTTKLAAYDLIVWANAISATLPMGRGCITFANGTYTLYIAWDDNRSGVVYSDQANPTNCSIVSNTSSNDNDSKNPDPIISMSVQL